MSFQEERRTYARLVSMLGQEMLALQHRLSHDTNKDEGPQEGHHESEAPNNNASTSGESENEDGDDRDEDDEAANIKEVENDDDHRDETSIGDVGLDLDRKSTRLNSSHSGESRMPSSA